MEARSPHPGAQQEGNHARRPDNGEPLSASSAGQTDTFSSSSTHSTARTSTSAMADVSLAAPSHVAVSSNYAHPLLSILELESNTASSSALSHSFGINISRKGTFVAVFNTPNLWLIKAAKLPRLWAKTLEMKRKPVAIDISEDGFLLAVLSRASQVDIYETESEGYPSITKRRTISLLHEAETLAISPDGLTLITGNKFGIEVMSIGPGAPESCRRTLSGPPGDTLEFSEDGRTLLITGYARKLGSTYIYVLPGLHNGPLSEEGFPIPASPDTIWTGQVLFPETAKIVRQATLLPDLDTGHVNKLFAFNADNDTLGVYDIGDGRFTQTKMFIPDQQQLTRSKFIDDAMPAISPNTDLAAVALTIRDTTSIWVYRVPGRDFKPAIKEPEHHSPIQPYCCIPIPHDEVGSHHEISVLRWVKTDTNIQRLLAVGNTYSNETDSEGLSVPQRSKGVVIVLDFDIRKSPGGPASIPTKLSYDLDSLIPGEKLPEGAVVTEREDELIRTGTIAQRDFARALTFIGNQAPELPPDEQDDQDSTSETFSTPWSDPVRSTIPSSLSYEAAADVGQVAESRSPMTFLNFTKPDVGPDIRDDDMQSVSLMSDDIESLVESMSGTGNYRQAVVNYFVKMFTADVELFALYKEATQRVDQSKFVRNHQRLLKQLFLNLRSEGHSRSKALAVGFLRARSKRIQISSEICNLFKPSNATVHEKIIIMMEQDKDNFFLLDRFLHGKDSGYVTGNPGKQDPDLPQADALGEQSDDEDEDDEISSSGPEEAFQDDDALSILEATSEFLTSGRPFSLYKKSFRRFLYPASGAASFQEPVQLDVVQTGSEQELLDDNIEGQCGDVTDTRPMEVQESDTTQVMHNEYCPEEELSGLEKPEQVSGSIYLSSTPTRYSKPKLVTVTWKCRCGVIITDEYTEFVAGAVQTYIVERTLRQKDQANDQNTSSGTRRWFNSIQRALNRISNDLTKSFLPRQMQSQESSEFQVADDGPIESPPVSNSAGRPKHLQLCISLHIRYTQTSYTSHNLEIESDKCLYDLLRARYTKLTGRWKRLLSLRQIRQIRFVKFRLRQNKLVTIEAHSNLEARIRESLPRENDDDYDFAPPEPEFLPPIGHNEMMHYFYKPCTGQNDDFHIRRFPSHKQNPVPFQPTEEEKHVWGIELVESESREWLYLSIPIFIVFVSSMVFGIVWTMVLHDIQGGFTVAAYILTSGLALLGSIQVLLENV